MTSERSLQEASGDLYAELKKQENTFNDTIQADQARADKELGVENPTNDQNALDRLRDRNTNHHNTSDAIGRAPYIIVGAMVVLAASVIPIDRIIAAGYRVVRGTGGKASQILTKDGSRELTKAEVRQLEIELAAAPASGSLADRLAAQRFRSVSGVEKYDRLAAHSPEELQQFVRDVEANGWIVKPTTQLDGSTPAYFFPRKGRFYYDPERMTYLDMLHERKHLDLFIERGNWKLGKSNSLLFQD